MADCDEKQQEGVKDITVGIRIFPLLAALAFFFFSCFLVSLSLSRVSQLELTASTDHTDAWQLFFSVANTKPKFSGDRVSNVEELSAGGKKTLVFYQMNHPVTWLRIDPGSKPGTVRLYELVVKRRLAADTVFTARDIYTSFHVGHAGMVMKPGQGYVEISSTAEDPFLISLVPILRRQHLGFMVLPIVLLSFFLYQGLSHLNLARVGDFFMIHRKLPSGNSVIEVLDGLRGMAALMVVADHTWPRFVGVGASGVLIFFSLSGFLLARPFVCSPEKIKQRGFLLHYTKRRLFRILPMYYFYILLVYVLSMDFGDAVLHAFFLKGDGHLWAIPQEMLFYLIFPLVALANLVLFQGKIRWILSSTVLLILGSYRFLGIDVMSLYGMYEEPLPFYLGIFLCGCWCAYFYFGWYVHYKSTQRGCRFVKPWFWGVVGCGILVLFWLFSNGHLLGNSRIFSQQFYGRYGVAAAVLLFSLLADEKSPLSQLLSWSVLRSLGIISYSLYLLHPLVLDIIVGLDEYFFNLHLHGIILFILTFLCSLPIAVITYRYIESPFMGVDSHKRIQQ